MASLLDLVPRCSAPEVVGFANQILSGDEVVTAPKVGVADRADPQPFAAPCPGESGRGTPDDRRGDRELRPDGPEVGDADRVEPAALLRREGIEYLGTYTLFHLDGAAWGIRLYVDRIAATAAKHAPNVGLTARHATAALLVDVLLHEWHHFIEEMVGSLLELDLGLPLVAHFQREVYRNTWPDVRNEALANAFALSELPRHLRASAPVIQKAKRLAKEVMDQCPGAYSRYGEFLRVHSRPASGPYGAGVAAWVMGDVLRSAMSIAPADASAAGAPTANTAGFEGLSQLPVGVLARARKAGTWPMHAAVPVRLLEEGGALAGTFWNVMRTA